MFGKIGCRAHDYGQHNLQELLGLISQDQFETMQLAFKKALVEAQDLNSFLTLQKAKEVKAQLEKYNLQVSVLGAYLNYAGSTEERKEENLKLLEAHIRIAKHMNVRMVGTETGSINDDYSFHVDNHKELGFNRFLESMQKALEYAKKYDVFLAIEPVSNHILNSPIRTYEFMKAVQHDKLKVIFDISNLMTISNYKEQDDIILKMFDLLEDEILAIHVKDFDFVDEQKIIVPLGEGKLNLDLLLKKAFESHVVVDILAENIERDKLRTTCLALKEKLLFN